MTAKHVVLKGGCWTGRDQYSFTHEGRLFFSGQNFHSEEHAKREAVQYLSCIGIEVEVEDIVVHSDGTL